MQVREKKYLDSEGRLYFRGYKIQDLVQGFMKNGRFGFEEVAYLLLFGKLPKDAELEEFFQNLKYSLAGIKVSARLLSDMEIIELIHRELNKNTNDKIKNIIEEGGLDFYVEAKSKA